MITYVAETEGVRVSVRPVYLDEQSDIFEKRFVFGYFIQIENQRDTEVQLLRRHWLIYNAHGKLTEVEGQGVIGRKPLISPGQVHEYGSFCVLDTFEGYMEGTYLMEEASGYRFKVAIPRFTLRAAAN